MGTLYDDLCTFIIASCQILLRMRNVLGKSCRKKNTNFVFSSIFHKLCHMWDTVQKYGTPGQTTVDNVLWCTCFAHWISKAVDTHPEYVILIAFPLQQSFANTPYCYVICTLHFFFLRY